jgi:cyclohexanone monooxygenase
VTALEPEVTENWDANRTHFRQTARTSTFGIVFDQNLKSALEVSPEEREAEFERRWNDGGLCMYGAYADIFVNKESNETAAQFVHSKIRGIVRDPAIAEKLLLKEYPLGTKRLCVDTGYYETFNRENVALVDVREAPIEEITSSGLRTNAAEYALDDIVFATGFDAMTGALTGIDIRGRAGVSLKEKWSAGPRTYLGIVVAGFPNLFMVTGPGSPSVFSNMVVSIEQHVDWIADCLRYASEHEFNNVEASADAENAWVDHVNLLTGYTLFPVANSWYVGANVPGKPRVFTPYIGGVENYRQKCDDIASKGYEGFAFRRANA